MSMLSTLNLHPGAKHPVCFVQINDIFVLSAAVTAEVLGGESALKDLFYKKGH